MQLPKPRPINTMMEIFILYGRLRKREPTVNMQRAFPIPIALSG